MRFQPSRGSSTVDHLLNITQKGSVDEYRDRFEELSVELPHVSDDVLESAFLKGLRKSLRDQVVRCRPGNMTDIVEIARLIESQENDSASYQVRSFNKSNSNPSATQGYGGGRSSDYSQAKKPYENNRDQRRTTCVGENRNTNSCRNCGEKWFLGHRCEQPHLKCLEVGEEGEQEEVEEEMVGEKNVECHQAEEQELVTLSLSSMVGLTAEK